MGIIQRQGIKNAIIQYTGIFVGFVSVLFIQPKFLSKEDLGLVSVFLNFSLLLSTVASLGAANMNFKYFPFYRNIEKGHHGYFGFMLLFPLAGFIIVTCLALVFEPVFISPYAKQSPLFVRYLPLTFLLFLIMTVCSILTSYLSCLFKSVIPSILNDIVPKAAPIAITLLYYFRFINRDVFIGLYVGTYFLILLLLVGYIYKVDKPSLKIDFTFFKNTKLREMIAYSLIMVVPTLASQAFNSLDVVILSKYVVLANVAVFSIAKSFPMLIQAPLIALDRISAPKIGESWANNDLAEIEKVYVQSTKYLMLFGGLLFVGINVNIESIFKIIPNHYDAGVPIVWVLSTGAFINCFSGINSSIIFNSPKYIFGTIVLLLYFPVVFLCYGVFIPRFGIVGAALSTSFSILIINSMRTIFLYRNYKLQPFDINTLYIVLMVLGCLGVNYFIPSLGNPFLDIPVRSVVVTVGYISAMYFLKIVPEFDHLYSAKALVKSFKALFPK